jgi:hypothetical protein
MAGPRLEVNSPQLFLTEAAGIDPVVAFFMADGTPYNSCSVALDDFVLNRMIDQNNICAVRKLLHGPDITRRSLLCLKANDYKGTDGNIYWT